MSIARPSACWLSSCVPATRRKLNAEQLSADIEASSFASKSSTRRICRIGKPSAWRRRNSSSVRAAIAAATTSSPRAVVPSNVTCSMRRYASCSKRGQRGSSRQDLPVIRARTSSLIASASPWNGRAGGLRSAGTMDSRARARRARAWSLRRRRRRGRRRCGRHGRRGTWLGRRVPRGDRGHVCERRAAAHREHRVRRLRMRGGELVVLGARLGPLAHEVLRARGGSRGGRGALGGERGVRGGGARHSGVAIGVGAVAGRHGVVALGDDLARAALEHEVERTAEQDREDQVGDEGVEVEPARAAAAELDERGDRVGALRALRLGLAGQCALVLVAAAARVEKCPAVVLGPRVGPGLFGGGSWCCAHGSLVANTPREIKAADRVESPVLGWYSAAVRDPYRGEVRGSMTLLYDWLKKAAKAQGNNKAVVYRDNY